MAGMGLISAAWATDYHFAPVGGVMSSPYGWRTDPMTGASRFHGGVDIAAPAGSPVYAPQEGMVVFSGPYGGYGEVVVLQHPGGLYTLYGHNSQRLVQAGESVQRGRLLALVGSTGRATGPHLHFEVRSGNRYLDPLSYLSALENAGMPQNMALIDPNSLQSPVDNNIQADPEITAAEASRLPSGGPELDLHPQGSHKMNAGRPVTKNDSGKKWTVEVLEAGRSKRVQF